MDDGVGSTEAGTVDPSGFSEVCAAAVSDAAGTEDAGVAVPDGTVPQAVRSVTKRMAATMVVQAGLRLSAPDVAFLRACCLCFLMYCTLPFLALRGSFTVIRLIPDLLRMG